MGIIEVEDDDEGMSPVFVNVGSGDCQPDP
ncbi:unnamed protein product, partial [Rotaria magnacalcarata]